MCAQDLTTGWLPELREFILRPHTPLCWRSIITLLAIYVYVSQVGFPSNYFVCIYYLPCELRSQPISSLWQYLAKSTKTYGAPDYVVSPVVHILYSVLCMCSQTSPLFHISLYWCDQNIGFPLHVEQMSPFRLSSSFILTEVWNGFAHFTQACSHGPHRWMKW